MTVLGDKAARRWTSVWRRGLAMLLLTGLWPGAGPIALAQAAAPPTSADADSAPSATSSRIGVVDLARLVDESPQAQQAKDNMAKRFAGRKSALEQAASALQSKMDRLEQGGDLSDDKRQALSEQVRDGQRELATRQGQYNDDVSDAEARELKTLRGDLRSVIDAYAKSHDYDVILGDSVLYSAPHIDVTDEILARLRQRP